MATPRTDKIYGYLKTDGTYVWFRFSINDAGLYEFVFQTGTSAPDQALVVALPYFQNILNYPGATTTTGAVIPSSLFPATPGTFPDGSSANPSITFTNDLDTGFYLAGANTIGLATGGVAIGTFGPTGSRLNGMLNQVAVPATLGSSGATGDFACDGVNAYFCYAANTWCTWPVTT